MIVNEELIKFTNLENKFDKYFRDKDNKQILFSGAFGSGKTTFLKSYFHARNEDFEVFYLYPVNYSLHSNSDIYEIIKYDIILELITKGVFKEIDISNLARYTSVIANKVDQAFIELISLFSKTGKKLKGAVDLFEKLNSDLKKEVNQLSEPLLPIKEFGDIIDKLKGYNYEDYITSVIKEKLEGIEKVKKKVLVVDDLDRIDPDHLFRIISVFSAHIDYESEENKFGFDKIIFVGDIENIKSMFEHKFGIKNSFKGFISKLGSKTEFSFNPGKELYSVLSKIISEFKIRYEGEETRFQLFNTLNSNSQMLFVYLIANLLNNKSISLRDLQKNKTEIIELSTGYSKFLQIQYNEYDLYNILKVLIHIIPSREDLIMELEKGCKNPLPIYNVLNNQNIDKSVVISNMTSSPLFVLCFNKDSSISNSEEFQITVKNEQITILGYNDSKSINNNFRIIDDLANEKRLCGIIHESFQKLINVIYE